MRQPGASDADADDREKGREWFQRVMGFPAPALPGDLFLDTTLRVRSANRAFFHTFRVSAEETESRCGSGMADFLILNLIFAASAADCARCVLN